MGSAVEEVPTVEVPTVEVPIVEVEVPIVEVPTVLVPAVEEPTAHSSLEKDHWPVQVLLAQVVSSSHLLADAHQ